MRGCAQTAEAATSTAAAEASRRRRVRGLGHACLYGGFGFISLRIDKEVQK